MLQTSTVTQKGQVTIPIILRKEWGLKPLQKVVFIKRKKVVEVKPAIDFFQLKGSLQTQSKYSDTKANKNLKDYFFKEDAR